MAESVLEIQNVGRLAGCCALLEVYGMITTIPEDNEDDEVQYQTGKSHTAVTHSVGQDDVEVKLMKQGFRQVANWNNEDGERLNLWFRGPKNHVMKAFPRPPAAPRARARRRRAR